MSDYSKKFPFVNVKAEGVEYLKEKSLKSIIILNPNAPFMGSLTFELLQSSLTFDKILLLGPQLGVLESLKIQLNPTARERCLTFEYTARTNLAIRCALLNIQAELKNVLHFFVLEECTENDDINTILWQEINRLWSRQTCYHVVRRNAMACIQEILKN